MDKKKIAFNIKFIISLIIVGLFVWYLIISPMMKFHDNEKQMINAAKRYFEINSNELPTGKRTKTLSLSTLYSKSYLENDFYVPYTSNVCDQTDSWIKVRKNNSGEYEYLVYLDCGVLQSSIDHTGPEIKLNGSEEVTIGLGSKYKEEGVKSVVDNTDGKLDVKDVVIKGNVDTSKVGTYEVEYIAFDSLKNRTSVTRKVNVINNLNSVVKKALNGAKNFTGNPTNNYVRLSNMLYRVYGLDSNNNIILVAAEDVSNVNYTKLNEWLNKYYYNHLNDFTKKLIVKSKYCNMKITDTTTDTTECSGYTDKVNIFVPSVVDVNKAAAGSENFMKTYTMSWVGNSGDDGKAYVTREIFFGEDFGKSFLSYENDLNFGVRPMFTIKGNISVVSGDGTITNPYSFGDSTPISGGEELNKASTGEYVEISGDLYRVIDVENGYTKVIAEESIVNSNDTKIVISPGIPVYEFTYDTKKKGSIGYKINNESSQYIDTSYFTNHDVSVPIYKKDIIYGSEVKTEKYKAKVFAPNMYEMFSAQVNLFGHNSHSYWYLNTSKTTLYLSGITDTGVPLNKVSSNVFYGIRPCAYIKKSTIITSGKGTRKEPYIIK
ncbi:MAG: DUF5011 domain-containing protein [Mollicutes bacterium]|nr:DUF5011 domain-containing protein [Mollicutes bacterium]